MRIGYIEGTPQEIKDLCENHGLNLGDYLEKPESPLATVWLIIPACAFVVSIIFEVFFRNFKLLSLLAGGGSLTWLARFIHLGFDFGLAGVA